ncbi:MAG: nicotinate-nicotinamide nucleotide adenylyltransferase [Myxococcota bacterium]
MKRVAVYGGSFNPPHVGHAMVAAWLRWTDRVDEVWLVPTFDHAFGKVLLPFDLRVELCTALAETVGPWVLTNPIEQDLPVPSYTVDTLGVLAKRHPNHRFHLVVGADVLPETPRWKAWSTIEERFAPIVVGRGGYPDVSGAPTFPTVSSTAIRDALVQGAPIDGLVPTRVLQILADADAASLFSAVPPVH